jgi:A/G-specific adenine glycosylase
MLQQTQVATVLPYYIEWLRRFPDFATLAAAPESDVLHAWQGLGYYNRARNLHATAKAVVAQYGGKFPRAASDARRLPGIGRYTANAVATFAFDQSVPVVEANISRLLARLNNVRVSIDSAAALDALWSSAAALLPIRGAGVYNAAPNCSACPVKRFCRAPDPLELPVKRAKAATRFLTERHTFVLRRGKLLLEQSTTRWRGMWILPRIVSAPRAQLLHTAEFPFTNHRVTLQVFNQPIGDGALRWVRFDELPQIPIPSPHRRAVEHLLNARRDSSTSQRMATK